MTKRDVADLFGTRFLTEPAPSRTFPEEGMTADDVVLLGLLRD
ncbi:hypothetical protein ACFCWV_35250 [Streptomyces sp. NPDC056341]